MGAYVATLFGAINVVYERDLSLHLTVSEVHAWTTPILTPAPTRSPSSISSAIGGMPNRPWRAYPRAFVHYLSGHSGLRRHRLAERPLSGRLSLRGNDWGGGYGLTQVYGTYPLQFWDQFAVGARDGAQRRLAAHALLDLRPTPTIDQCYSGESGCYSGSNTPPAPRRGHDHELLPPACGRYNNMSLKFHAALHQREDAAGDQQRSLPVRRPATFDDVPTYEPSSTLRRNGRCRRRHRGARDARRSTARTTR